MTPRRGLALLVVAVALTAIAVLAPSALGRSQAKATGVATITVVNKGQATHDLRIAGKKTKILNPGQRATLKVTLKKGTYAYLCTVPGHAALGMKGKLVVK